MEEVSSKFIPVPHLSDGVRSQGFIADWTKTCDRCNRQCESSTSSDISLCSYGVNYAKATPDILLFGFLIRGKTLTAAQSKAVKLNPKSIVSREHVEKTLKQLRSDIGLFREIEIRVREKLLEEYRVNSMFEMDLLELLKPEIKKSLAFLHDYRQFASRVKQHINVILQTRYPYPEIEKQLASAHTSEKAIYHSAVMMDDKLETALLLTQPERLKNARRSQFGLHGFILKHLRIYQVAFDEKDIRVLHTGHSYGQITAPQAFAAIPHAFLDNALKYSSRGSQAVLSFTEDAECIDFAVTSFGPKIEAEETQSIFELFRRGKAGVAQREEGSGIGLFLAQFIARDLGTEIKVKQSAEKTVYGYETTFSIRLHRSA